MTDTPDTDTPDTDTTDTDTTDTTDTGDTADTVEDMAFAVCCGLNVRADLRPQRQRWLVRWAQTLDCDAAANPWAATTPLDDSTVVDAETGVRSYATVVDGVAATVAMLTPTHDEAMKAGLWHVVSALQRPAAEFSEFAAAVITSDLPANLNDCGDYDPVFAAKGVTGAPAEPPVKKKPARKSGG